MKLWRETGKNTKKGNKNGEMSNPQKSGKNRRIRGLQNYFKELGLVY